MSKRKSECKFLSTPSKNNHFYIFKSLPIDFRKCLSTQWENGVMEILYQEKFNNVSVNILANTPLVYQNHKWQQKVIHFYNLERNIVMPIDTRLSPTQETTPHFMYLSKQRKLYFEIDPENENLDLNAWLRRQVRLGHSFYDIMDNEMWIPRHKDQIRSNDLVPRVQEIEQLKKENLHLKSENAILYKERNEYADLNNKYADLNNKYADLVNKYVDLNEK